MATRTRTRHLGRPKTAMTTRLQGVPSRRDPSIASPFKIATLPCLRCGNLAVPIIPLFVLKGRSASTFLCRFCDAEHYLSVTRERGAFVVCYQRYTLRYPLEYYDDGVVLLTSSYTSKGTRGANRTTTRMLGPSSSIHAKGVSRSPRSKRYGKRRTGIVTSAIGAGHSTNVGHAGGISTM